MAEILPFLREPNGIIREWHTNSDGTYTIVSRQPYESQLLDHNKETAANGDGYTPSREMQRVASIPPLLLEYWQTVEGWNPFNPENADKLQKRLDSPDFQWLRTIPGKIGKRQRHV